MPRLGIISVNSHHGPWDTRVELWKLRQKEVNSKAAWGLDLNCALDHNLCCLLDFRL